MLYSEMDDDCQLIFMDLSQIQCCRHTSVQQRVLDKLYTLNIWWFDSIFKRNYDPLWVLSESGDAGLIPESNHKLIWFILSRIMFGKSLVHGWISYLFCCLFLLWLSLMGLNNEILTKLETKPKQQSTSY